MGPNGAGKSTLARVILGLIKPNYGWISGILLSLATGSLGSFLIWKKMSYFADTLSHASLLGIAISIHVNMNPISLSLGLVISSLSQDNSMNIIHYLFGDFLMITFEDVIAIGCGVFHYLLDYQLNLLALSPLRHYLLFLQLQLDSMQNLQKV
uniref:Uncharacterized protein n=1 Tax=Glossina austeni TaxID=7395 RepID=A0A1A9UKN4_GLOAU